MSFSLENSNPQLTAQAGFGKVKDIPFLMDSASHYHDRGSEYLIDRGLGYWNPKTGFHGQRRKPPTEVSLRNYGWWLANFLHWAEETKSDPAEMDYWEDIYEGYQAKMQSGEWSDDGRTLLPTTINPRVDVACDYLRWLSAKGFREEFYVPTEVRRQQRGDSRHKQTEVRQGKVPVSLPELVMPSPADVRRWLEDVGKLSGAALQLACETILRTGIRLSELVGLRLNVLPENRRDWAIANPDAPLHKQEVLVKIKYGVKGPGYGKDQDKIGPEQTIRVPLDLAVKWDVYRKKKELRPAALALFVGEAKTLAEKRQRIAASVHLFLNEKTGERLTQDQVYRAWKNKKGYAPFPEWRPHMGRHWWACSTLSQEVDKLEVIKKLGPDASIQMVRDVSLQIIDLRIQPQLRQRDASTTHRYLVWMASRFSAPIELEYDALINAEELQS